MLTPLGNMNSTGSTLLSHPPFHPANVVNVNAAAAAAAAAVSAITPPTSSNSYNSSNSNSSNYFPSPTDSSAPSLKAQAFSLVSSMPPPHNMSDITYYKTMSNHPTSASPSSTNFDPSPMVNSNLVPPPVPPRSRNRAQNQKAMAAAQAITSLPATFMSPLIDGYEQPPISQDGNGSIPYSNDGTDHQPSSFSQGETLQGQGQEQGQEQDDGQSVFVQGGSPHRPVFAHTVTEDTGYTSSGNEQSAFSQGGGGHSLYTQNNTGISAYTQAGNGQPSTLSFHQDGTQHASLRFLSQPHEYKRRSSPALLENCYKPEQYGSGVMSAQDQDLAGISQQMEAAMLLANFHHRQPDSVSRKDVYADLSWDDSLSAQPVRQPTSLHRTLPYSNAAAAVVGRSLTNLRSHASGVYANPNPNDIRRHSFDVSSNWTRSTQKSQITTTPDAKPIFDYGAVVPPSSYGSSLPSVNDASSLPSVMEPSSSTHYRPAVAEYCIDEFAKLSSATGSERRLTWSQSGCLTGMHDAGSGSGMLDSSILGSSVAQQSIYCPPYGRGPYQYTSAPSSLNMARPNAGHNHTAYPSTHQQRKRALIDEAIPDPNSAFEEDFLAMGSHLPPSPTDSFFRKRTKSLDMTETPFCDESDLGDMLMDDGSAELGADSAAYPDMTPEDIEAANQDPEAKPRRQRVRYPGDKYTPQWVRHQGQQKEGFCDLCQPGKWLQLKNSAYWYHKQFFHGISSVSGKEFEHPQEHRWDSELTEGLCHQCHQWIPIQNSKRKNSMLWYRHAHKCHVYHKPRAQQTHAPKKR